MQFPSGLVVNGSTSYGAAMSSFIFIQGTKGWPCLTPAFPLDEERRLTGKMVGQWFGKDSRSSMSLLRKSTRSRKRFRKNPTIEPDGAQGFRDMNIIQAIYQPEKQKSIAMSYQRNLGTTMSSN